MLFINFLAQIVNLLRSAATPSQIAAGFAIGMIAGLVPSLFILIVIILLFVILDVNISSGLLATAMFGVIGYLIDPFSHSIGYAILVQIGFLRPIWAFLYNSPILPLSGFNNTVIMGNMVLSIILFIPVFSTVRLGIIFYNKRYREKVEQSALFRYLQSWNVYQWYLQLKKIGDKLW